MDRFRSKKRGYYHDQQENYSSRTKPRYSASSRHHYHPNSNRQQHRSNSGSRAVGRLVDLSAAATTTFRILCHDAKVGGVIGKSGSIIKSIRNQTGAWISVLEIASGDEERIIEITDSQMRDPDGRMPSFSPAQEALLLVHERILESEPIGAGVGGYNHYHDEEGQFGGSRGGGNRVVTRLVVSRTHVGSLLGKGGKIVEQMRMETKTQIKVFTHEHSLPRCVSPGEEIVQVVGDANAVQKAMISISSRLRESQHRDRGNFEGRLQSDDRYFEDSFIPRNNLSRGSSADGDSSNPRLLLRSTIYRNNNESQPSSRAYDSEAIRDVDRSKSVEELIFRILCPNHRVDSVVGESNGIVQLLKNEVGVDVKLSDPFAGSEEKIIVISSDEKEDILYSLVSDDLSTCSISQGLDDELFPAQEALLHIQTRIMDLVPDKENIAITRLLFPSSEIGFLNGNSSLSEVKKVTGADIEILPREKVPPFVGVEDELLQIVGDIKAAREAVVELTARLRSYMYKDSFTRDMSSSAAGSASAALLSENMRKGTGGQSPKVAAVSYADKPRSNESDRKSVSPTSSNRFQAPLVTRSTLEVVVPEYAVPKLLAQQKRKLGQISGLSGARVAFAKDGPEETEKVIRISGTPEQVERAQSLLQGFLLSIQEDGS